MTTIAFWRALAAAWLAGAVIVWNGVFDASIVAGARDYVDRQQRFIEGRGPHVDVDQVMNAAKSSGVRVATGWALAELLPGVAVGGWIVLRRRP